MSEVSDSKSGLGWGAGQGRPRMWESRSLDSTCFVPSAPSVPWNTEPAPSSSLAWPRGHQHSSLGQ